MFVWKSWIIPGVVTVVLLTVASAFLFKDRVESDLSARVGEILEARHGWAGVEADGRDVVLSGTAPSEAASADALKLTRQVRGVRTAHSDAELLALESPYRLSITHAGRTVTMEGFVPDEATRASIRSILAASVPESAFDDRLALARGAPEHFLPLVGYAAAQLAGLGDARIELADARLSIKGTATSPRAYDNVLDALEAGLPGGELAEADIAPPRVSPFVWNLSRKGQTVALSGHAPSREARAGIIADLRDILTDEQLENHLEIASGLEEGVDWQAATVFLGQQLSHFANASVTVSDHVVTLEGEAADPEAFAALVAAFDRDLPAGLTLASADISRPIVDPYTWSIHIAEDGTAELGGYVPGSAFAEKLTEALRAQFGQDVRIRNDLQVASGAPQGFEQAVLAVIGTAGRLTDMEASFSGDRIVVGGQALTGTAANETRNRIATALPPGFELQANIEMLAPGAALTAQDCQAGLSTELRRASILFETGSSDIRGESLGLLDRLAFILRRCPDTYFEIGGHTDAEGTEEANLALSTARARAVVERLVRSGVRYSRVFAKGYGESLPVADNATPEGRARNRRIEFRIVQ